ncbi:MAG: hypothetical protein OXC82_13155 [Rhodobacteraceae bacterium]|nr:hypothetical protein [Paracoccaceae bacterium]MCY4251367.1 hypothetical protein [Paracoccaceae bacterium]
MHEAFSDLADYCEDILETDRPDADFAGVEEKAVEVVSRFGRMFMAKVAGNRDDGVRSIGRGGRSWYRAKPSGGTFHCLFGKVDDECSLAEMPVRKAKEIFDGFIGSSPAVSTWQKLSRMVDWSWKNVSEKALADIRGNEDIPEDAASVVLSLDGVDVLLRPGENPIGITGDDDTEHKGNWREASCGTMTFLDGRGEPLHTTGSGWMPEHLKETLKKWLSDGFKVIMTKRPDLTSVGAADSAKDNRSFLSGQEVTEEIVDFHHATTHLSKASGHAASKEDWYGEWRSVLLEEDNGVDRVLGAIEDIWNRSGDEEAREELRTICNCFNERRGRMQHADLKRRGLPIGSGCVEAANKTHVEERMKRSGMRWSRAGGQAMLGIRSLVRSGRFDRSWEYIVEELKRRKPANDNWNPWHEKRKAA